MYLVNKTEGILTLKQGFINVPKGGAARITEVDEKHSDVIYAINAGFAELSDTKPTTPEPTPVPLTVVEPDRGLTEAQYLAEMAAKKAAEETPAVEPVIEEVVEVPAVEPVVETPAPKKTSKAKAH